MIVPIAFIGLLPTVLSAVLGMDGETGPDTTDEPKSFFERQLENLLEAAGEMSLIEIRQKIDEIVSQTDEETRKRHEDWKIQQHIRDNSRRERIKDAVMKLSKPAQAKLIRIIFVQEDEELTQNKKRVRLNEINRSLTPEVRKELTEKLKGADVFGDFGIFSK